LKHEKNTGKGNAHGEVLIPGSEKDSQALPSGPAGLGSATLEASEWVKALASERIEW
jgi:hypothetical protein